MPPSINDFTILLALAGGDNHAYGIIQQIKEDSAGLYFLKDRSLYAAIDRLAASGLVEEQGYDSHGRQRYHLLPRGRLALQAETVRLDRTSGLLRKRLRG